MYRRYEPPRRQQMPQTQPQQNHRNQIQQNNRSQNNYQQKKGQNEQRNNYQKPADKCIPPPKKAPEIQKKKAHPLTDLIPRSLYNPDTGKILGFFSAEDLLIAALILLLIDSGDDDTDNSILIYALLYILIEDHIDIPFL